MSENLQNLFACSTCFIEKHASEFGFQTTGKRKKRCARCERLMHSYGISDADYRKMYEEQNGVCAICLKPETAKSSGGKSGAVKLLAVDHDKRNGLIRGLLCQRCNTGIGNLLHSTEYLRSAINYLEATAK